MVRLVELRRATLLFAIVLGLAAVVTVLAGGSRDDRQPPAAALPAGNRPPPRPVTKPLRFSGTGPPVRLSAAVGEPVIVEVSADEGGDAELPGMGLLAPVEPSVPARFELLAENEGRYRITFARAGELRSRIIGTLVIETPDTVPNHAPTGDDQRVGSPAAFDKN